MATFIFNPSLFKLFSETLILEIIWYWLFNFPQIQYWVKTYPKFSKTIAKSILGSLHCMELIFRF